MDGVIIAAFAVFALIGVCATILNLGRRKDR